MPLLASRPISAQAIIDRAYSILGYKAAGESLSGEETAYALDVMNSLIDSWNTQSMFMVSVVESVALVSSASATIGTGLTFDVPRPTMIKEGAFARLNNIDYPIQVVDRATYERIVQKTIKGTFPQCAYYDAAAVTPTVYFYPVPVLPVEVHLPVAVYLSEFELPTTEFSLVPGYRKALEYSLAEELAPGIKDLSPTVIRMAANARRFIRRTNAVVPMLDINVPTNQRSGYNPLYGV